MNSQGSSPRVGVDIAIAVVVAAVAAGGHVLTAGADATPLRSWLLGPFANPPAGSIARGRTVCNCVNVTEAEILGCIQAGANLENDIELSAANIAFNREIAYASENVVLAQLLDVLTNLFQDEQRAILNVYGSLLKDLG
jgi:hypothetical protein